MKIARNYKPINIVKAINLKPATRQNNFATVNRTGKMQVIKTSNWATVHDLKSAHKQFCKANQPDVVGEAPTPMPKLERTATTETIASLVPTDEQIAAYMLNQRKIKANEKREK